MVSIPCNYSSVAARLPRLPHLILTRPYASPLLLLPPSPTKTRLAPRPINAVGTDAFGPTPRDQQQQPRTLFPGGFKRPEIKVPSLVLRLTAEEVLAGPDSAADVSKAVSRGVGIVVLDDGVGGNGGRLYEAACVLRPVVGDRAYLLITDRVDIAAAVGASGAVLTDQGIPAVVARNMMMKSRSDSVYLPLVARTVETGKSAVSASRSEGADFLIVGSGGENYTKIMEDTVTKQVKVPILFTVVDSDSENSLFRTAVELLQSGACGLVMSLKDVKLLSDDVLRKIFSTGHVLEGMMQDSHSTTKRFEGSDVRSTFNAKKGFAGFTKLDDKEMQLIEAERLLLHETVAVIRKAAPMMEDILLLEDAASRLTEPFLLVIVGEFNSGKSTVINALLGRRYLKEGVIPTTNEITLLCYSETDNNVQRCERNPDGQFICYLSAPILKEMNLVDTPGTNVILQRQQRLTEEFVPRADLILFVLSSDRPLTDSEVTFLLYVQQWKKQVVFVLNKLDLYRNTSELEEATTFIRENTCKLLNTEYVRLFPVSARSALEAKLSASTHNEGNQKILLSNDPRWLPSRFNEFENFLFSFMDGSTDTGKERMRLKLETPISIADRILISCEKLVKQEYEFARQDLISIEELVNSTKEYAIKMEKESISWKQQTLSLIERAKSRSVKLMESILQLSNIDLIATYTFKGERSNSIAATSTIQNGIILPAISDAQKLLEEYCLWLESSNACERKHYIDYFDERWQELVDIKDRVQPETHAFLSKEESLSINVMDNFSASAAARLFEQEVREVVLGTFGGLGAAGLSASLLTSVLPTTVEDLLALAFCSAGGLFTISKFPVRRNEAIAKVHRVSDGLARDIEDAMQKDLLQAIEELSNFVKSISKPYQDAAQNRIKRLLEIEDDLANVGQKLQFMKVEIQNLHVS